MSENPVFETEVLDQCFNIGKTYAGQVLDFPSGGLKRGAPARIFETELAILFQPCGFRFLRLEDRIDPEATKTPSVLSFFLDMIGFSRFRR